MTFSTGDIYTIYTNAKRRLGDITNRGILFFWGKTTFLYWHYGFRRRELEKLGDNANRGIFFWKKTTFLYWH